MSYNFNDADQREAAMAEKWAECCEENTLLRQQLEIERMRLVACGVVALSNTPESAAKARDMLPEYRSASCDDVARAVDREMELRQQLATLRELKQAWHDKFWEQSKETNQLRQQLAATAEKEQGT